MQRKDFIQKSLYGVGALSMTALLQACSKTDVKEDSGAPELVQSSAEHPAPDTPLTSKIVREDEGRQLNVIGDNQRIKLTGKDTGGKFTLIEQHNNPGVGIPPHVHGNEDEVFQVISGQVEMTIADKTTKLSAGDIIFCPRGIPHAWRVVGEEKAHAMLSIFPAGLEHMFEALSALPPGPPDIQKVAAICGKYNVTLV